MENYICMEEVVASYKNEAFIRLMIVPTILTMQPEKSQSERKGSMVMIITSMKMEQCKKALSG